MARALLTDSKLQWMLPFKSQASGDMHRYNLLYEQPVEYFRVVLLFI